MSSNSSPFHQFPPSQKPPPNVKHQLLAEVTWVFPPCLAQQLGVLWPLRCWWLSPRRGGQGGPCFGGETGNNIPPCCRLGNQQLSETETKKCVSRPKWDQRGWNVFSFHYSLWCITTRLFCGPQVWLESSWALVSAKLQSCHPWASKLSCLPAVRVEAGHCVYVPFEDDKSLPNIQWWLMTLFWKILSISAFQYTN